MTMPEGSISCHSKVTQRKELECISLVCKCNFKLDAEMNKGLQCYVRFLIPNPYRGYNKKFMRPMTRIDVYKVSFFQSAIKTWSSLPQHMIGSTEIEHSLVGLESMSTTLAQYNNKNTSKACQGGGRKFQKPLPNYQ